MERENILQREFLTVNGSLQIRQAAEGSEPSRTIVGRAIVFEQPSAVLYDDRDVEVREVIARGAITHELLDKCDIKFLLFHDRDLILARSRNGQGTLRYDVDDDGVTFELDAPHTADGDKALELVARGDVSGCSFAFSTLYSNPAFVEKQREIRGNKAYLTCRVKKVTGVYDMSLVADPAYPATSTELRDIWKEERGGADAPVDMGFVERMRSVASRKM